MPILKGACLCHAPILIPEIGKGEERKVSLTERNYIKACKELASLDFDTVILISPHAECYSDAFALSYSEEGRASFIRFGAPQVTFQEKYDLELSKAVKEEGEKLSLPMFLDGYSSEDFSLDHGSMVPLYFLEKEKKDFKLVRMAISGLSFLEHYRLGIAIKNAVNRLGRKAVFIASGDLSHCQKEDGPYGFKEVGPVYDEKIMKTLGEADFLGLLEYDPDFVEDAQVCGHPSFSTLAGVFDKEDVSVKVYSHEATFGVGYGIVTYTPTGEDDQRNFLDQAEEKEKKRLEANKKDPYVLLAKEAIRLSFTKGRNLSLKDFPSIPEELLHQRAGCFVSLHEFSQLRGCIGTMKATKDTLAEEIISNALMAAYDDNRFTPLQEREEDFLEISVDVLSPLKRIPSEKELDPKKYGVFVVSEDYKTGVLLPDLPGVDSIPQQVSIAKRKGNISSKEKVTLYRFTVERHK